jgi:hypothetical protein
LSAFDGYHSSGPALQPSVLERPAGFQRLTVLQQLLQRGRRFISSIAEFLLGSISTLLAGYSLDRFFVLIRRKVVDLVDVKI